MLKQAQQLQKRMEQMQEEMETLTVEGSAGGGAVTAVVTGKMHVLSITIDPDVVDPDDVDLLQDMVLAAVNDGLRRAEETVSKQMASLTGGLKIPGLM
jgi:DNA-binding YbaB/EbfC family protein